MESGLVVEVFPWRDEYSIGIADVDAQHKVLVRLINDLQAAMLGQLGEQVLGSILDDLVRYTEVHFAYEEKLMSHRGYRRLIEHRREHRRLAREVVDLRDRFQTSRLTISAEVLLFLRNWLANHIMGSDQDITRQI